MRLTHYFCGKSDYYGCKVFSGNGEEEECVLLATLLSLLGSNY